MFEGREELSMYSNIADYSPLFAEAPDAIQNGNDEMEGYCKISS